MTRWLACAAACAALLVAGPCAMAASSDTPPANLWRASKLPGLAVYGPDTKKVGSISDVLISRDGRADYVVIGVGGFLGLGEKDVAVAFDQVTFVDQPITPPVAPAPPAPASSVGPAGKAPQNAAAPNGGIAPDTSVGLGTQTDSPAKGVPTPGAAAPAPRHPDHATVAMTADQLKAAPAFHFAR